MNVGCDVGRDWCNIVNFELILVMEGGVRGRGCRKNGRGGRGS